MIGGKIKTGGTFHLKDLTRFFILIFQAYRFHARNLSSQDEIASFRQKFTHTASKILDRRQPACEFYPCPHKIYAQK